MGSRAGAVSSHPRVSGTTCKPPAPRDAASVPSLIRLDFSPIFPKGHASRAFRLNRTIFPSTAGKRRWRLLTPRLEEPEEGGRPGCEEGVLSCGSHSLCSELASAPQSEAQRQFH